VGQVGPKYFYPSAPYGQSQATSSLNQVQPVPQSPQVPLLPSNTVAQSNGAAAAQSNPSQPMQPSINMFKPFLSKNPWSNQL